MNLAWKRIDDYSIAPHNKATGEKLPYTVCKVGDAFEAWTGKQQLATGLRDYRDAQVVIEMVIKGQGIALTHAGGGA
jgi:hypothetical protein